jgi:hypothetical protein
MANMRSRKYDGGPVETEMVGGPHDGTRLVTPCLRAYLEFSDRSPVPRSPGSPQAPLEPEVVRYELDPDCLDPEDGLLITVVARYLYQPRVLASA